MTVSRNYNISEDVSWDLRAVNKVEKCAGFLLILNK